MIDAGTIRTASAPLGLLKPLLPPVIAVYDTAAATSPRELHAAEEQSVSRAVPARRREFATGRHCARQALAALGVPDATILTGADREPMWPDGFVGSITHTAGYYAAAVARQRSILTIGIDAEVDEPLPEDVVPMISTDNDRRHLVDLYAAEPDVPWYKLLFTAKEAVYKAWFPCARRWLDFAEVDVVFSPAQQTFTATVPGLPTPSGPSLFEISGRWTRASQLLLAAIVVDQ